MTIAIASDHGGFSAKRALIDHLESQGYTVIDEGTGSTDSCDYPVYGSRAALDVSEGRADYGVLICNSGEGMVMVANKVKGIRAALLYNDEVAALAHQHNDANVIAFGANFMSDEDIIRRVDIFLSSAFEGGRHARRVAEISEVEEGKKI